MQRSTTGTKRRPAEYAIGVSTPPQSPGQTSTGLRRQRAEVVQVRADRLRPAPRAGQPVPRDDAPRLAGAEDATADDDRRGLEVVVAHVVLRHLVVPEELPGGRGQREQGVGVGDRARIHAAVRSHRRAAPGPGIRDPEVEAAVRRDRGRVPRATAAGGGKLPWIADRLEAPADLSRALVERIQRAAPARREADGRGEDEAARGERGDVDELLVAVRQLAGPQLAAGPCVECERARVACAENPSARVREAVRPVVRSLDEVVPAGLPSRRSSACTDELRSCTYTVEPTTSGVDANDPKVEPRVSGYRQRTWRPLTVLAVIVDATARVPRRSPLGCAQSADADAVRESAAAKVAATIPTRRPLDDGEVTADLAIDLVRVLPAVIEERAELALRAGSDRSGLETADVEDVRLRSLVRDHEVCAPAALRDRAAEDDTVVLHRHGDREVVTRGGRRRVSGHRRSSDDERGGQAGDDDNQTPSSYPVPPSTKNLGRRLAHKPSVYVRLQMPSSATHSPLTPGSRLGTTWSLFIPGGGDEGHSRPTRSSRRRLCRHGSCLECGDGEARDRTDSGVHAGEPDRRADGQLDDGPRRHLQPAVLGVVVDHQGQRQGSQDRVAHASRHPDEGQAELHRLLRRGGAGRLQRHDVHAGCEGQRLRVRRRHG